MLDRVTIASLGDLIQPLLIQQPTSWLRALKNAKKFRFSTMGEIQAALQKPLAIKGDEMTAHSSWFGNDKLSMRAVNNLFLKISGLQWLTGLQEDLLTMLVLLMLTLLQENLQIMLVQGIKLLQQKVQN